MGDFSGIFATALVPVVGVDLVADDSEAELLDADDRRGLIVGFGLFVDVVGGAEISGCTPSLLAKRRSVSLTSRSSRLVEISLMSGWK